MFEPLQPLPEGVRTVVLHYPDGMTDTIEAAYYEALRPLANAAREHMARLADQMLRPAAAVPACLAAKPPAPAE